MRKLMTTAFLLSLLFTAHAQQKNFIDQPYIDVSGYADTSVTPDEIYVRIIIAEGDTKNKISVEEQEAQIVDALKTIGINTEKDLTTNDIGSNFKYYFLKGKDVLKTKTYILKVTDAVMLGKVIGTLESINISNTSIDRVEYSDMENLKNMVKAKAVEHAKTSATVLTKPLNQTIGAAIFITENPGGNDYNELQGRVAGISIRGYSSARKQEELPKIDFEKIKVATTVNVKFILK